MSQSGQGEELEWMMTRTWMDDDHLQQNVVNPATKALASVRVSADTHSFTDDVLTDGFEVAAILHQGFLH